MSSGYWNRGSRRATSASTAGADLVEVGRRVLALAHEHLAEAEHRRKSRRPADREHPVRIGISSMLLDFLVDHPARTTLDGATVTSNICTKIVTAFDDHEVDVVMAIDARDHRARLGDALVAEFDIEFAWMRADTLVLEPEAPIPLAIWPADQHIVLNALIAAGRPYQVLFSGPEYCAKLTALRSGQCIAAVPRHAVAAPFVAATEPHLPAIPPQKMLLAVRGDPQSARFKPVVAMLSSFPLA